MIGQNIFGWILFFDKQKIKHKVFIILENTLGSLIGIYRYIILQ